MIKFNLGDSIFGERIIGWAGAIDKRGNIRINNILLKELRFRLGVECIVDLPIISNKSSSSNDTEASNNNTEEGLKGSKITGTAESFTNFKKVSNKTAGHTHWQTTLKDNATCTIDIPIISRRNIKKL